jgi:hypothetical protein
MIVRTILVKYITLGFAEGVAFFPFILLRPETQVTHRLINHERIHIRQQLEMLVFPFYIWYLLEYLIRLLQYKDHFLAYRNISFEREAYENDLDFSYRTSRRFLGWVKYLGK